MYLTSIHLGKNVSGHLCKCADECDIEALEIFTRSPIFLSLFPVCIIAEIDVSILVL